MKTTKLINNWLLKTFLFMSILVIMGCDLVNDIANPKDEKCGPEKTVQIDWTNDGSFTPLNPPEYFQFNEGGYHYYNIIPPNIENICAEEHIKARFLMRIDNTKSYDIRGIRVDYAPLFAYIVDPEYIIKDGKLSAGLDFEFGIFQVFGEDPGWISPMVTVGVPDLGSTIKNDSALIEVVEHIAWSFIYKEWKAK